MFLVVDAVAEAAFNAVRISGMTSSLRSKRRSSARRQKSRCLVMKAVPNVVEAVHKKVRDQPPAQPATAMVRCDSSRDSSASRAHAINATVQGRSSKTVVRNATVKEESFGKRHWN